MSANPGDLLMKILVPRRYQHEIRECIAVMHRPIRTPSAVANDPNETHGGGAAVTPSSERALRRSRARPGRA